MLTSGQAFCLKIERPGQAIETGNNEQMDRRIGVMNRPYEGERLFGLDNARGIAIFCVVLLHAYGYQQIQTSSVLFLTFMHFVSQVCITTFFLVDGILLYRNKERGKLPQYIPYLQSSANQLLVPWVIFSLGYLLLTFLYELVSGDVSDLFPIAGPIHFVEMMWLSQISTQLYFLPALFLARLFMFPLLEYLPKSPLLLFAGSLAAMTIYQFAAIPLHERMSIGAGTDPFLTALFAVPFFLAGIGLHRSNLLQKTASPLQSTLAVIGVLCLMALTPLVLDTFASRIQQLALVVALVCAVNISTPYTRPLGYLGKRSLVIFLLHMPIGIKVGQQVSSLVNLRSDFVDMFLVAGLAVLCALILTSILNVLMLSPLVFGKKVAVFPRTNTPA